MAKRYFWLKLKDDFFTSKRIKKLRSVAGGDTYVVIYLKMQLLALKTDGVIQFTGLEDDFASELALDLDENIDDVRFTLNYLQNVDLLETSDQINFFLPYVIENTGSETASTQRSRECRARKRCNATQMQQLCNGEKEIEIEIEKDIDDLISDEILFSVSEEEHQRAMDRIKLYKANDGSEWPNQKLADMRNKVLERGPVHL